MEISDQNVSIKKEAKARKRPAPDWNPDETQILIDEATANAHIIDGRYDNSVTKSAKNEIWQQISNKISQRNFHPRSPNSCKKKWQNTKCKANKKVRGFYKASTKTGKSF